jgi:nucleoside-diphosphate-sugar epimerase
MTTKVLLAGAAGVIGRRLTPLLSAAGYRVYGTTRHRSRAEALRQAGVTPVSLDIYDAPAVEDALRTIRPQVVIHQLTDLPADLDPAGMQQALERNARIRREGTANLAKAALAAGTRRFVVQSIAWMYAPAARPHVETDPLDHAAEGARAISLAGVVALEDIALHSPPMAGLVLRYGHLYGPGSGADEPAGEAAVHVDAAANAARLAIDKGEAGIYNIAEPDAYVDAGKAARELGWDPSFRLPDR